MRSIHTLLLYFTLAFSQILIAQSVAEKGYFMFPIKPGQVNYLTGSMGELRSNHFHAGIDIKTDFKIGLPVYCSADGYVSRIKISSYGYGKVLYITHPNGLTTVYAHLDKLTDTLAKWILHKQYELQSFDVDVYPLKNELLVKKGQIIAKSGNTGSSGGPHLHYEIRDEQEKILNPLLFGFKEIKDTEPPLVDFLALRTFGINSRVQNEFGKKDFKPFKIGKDFIIMDPIFASGEIGIEVKTHDKMNEMHNQYGISCMEVKVNGKETFFHNINKFSFDDGKKINAHLDYETLIYKNQRFQKCYISDGNNLASYKQTSHNGKLFIVPGQKYEIEIIVYDAYSNNSVLRFTIEGKEYTEQITSTETTKAGYRIFENILKIKSKTTIDTISLFYSQGKSKLVVPTYFVNKYPVYLYDLRDCLPDSIVIGAYSEKFSFVGVVPPFKKTNINFDKFQINFSDTSLIDTLYLQMKCYKDLKGNKVLELHNPSVPVFGAVQILYKPDLSEQITNHSYLALNGKKHEGSRILGKELLAQTKYLGKFVIVKDTISPVLKYVSHTAKSIKFNIFDSDSGIESFKASIDGNWILMNYEHKNKTLWSENIDKTKFLKGKFVLEVKDKAGNIKLYEKIL